MAKEFYISNKSNRCLLIIDIRPVSENDIDASYDERGNLLKLSGTQNLHWNYRDNIAYVDIITRPSGKNDSEYYVYDSSGQRVRKVTETYQNNERNFTRVEKIYFGDIEVTRTYQESDLRKEKYTVDVMDDKSRVALHHYYTKGSSEETKNNQSRYQLSNHLDSVALELNDNAEIMTYEEYLPFGGTALIAGKTTREVTEKEYRYSGKERDNSTGLYYYGARYYAPWLLRWINPDPAGTVDGPNLYRFVGGNPVNSVDVGGMMDSSTGTIPKQLKKPVKPAGESSSGSSQSNQSSLPQDLLPHEWDGWKVDQKRGDNDSLARLRNQYKVLKIISMGVNLALEEIQQRLGNEITSDKFKVSLYDVLGYGNKTNGSYEKYFIFPVEWKYEHKIKNRKGNTTGSYEININIDNPTNLNSEGPHGPHVGAEAKGIGELKGFKLHAHILLPEGEDVDLQGLEDIPGRDRDPDNSIYTSITVARKKLKEKGKRKVLIKSKYLFCAQDKNYDLRKQVTFAGKTMNILRHIQETFNMSEDKSDSQEEKHANHRSYFLSLYRIKSIFST